MTFCQLTECFHTFIGFAHNVFYFLSGPPAEFSHRPFRKPLIHHARPPRASAPEPYRAAQARAVGTICRQFLLGDLPSCCEGHAHPLAPSANTRRKTASIHYQSNNHAILNASGRACPIPRKKIVKTLLNLAMSRPLKPKICVNANFPVWLSLKQYPHRTRT